MTRWWTLAEARAALPEVIALLTRLRAAAGVIGAPSAALGGHATVNGHARPPRPGDDPRELLERLSEMGVQVKDLAAGLIDFPARRARPGHPGESEAVLLCYRLGEEDILYWHDLTSGYAGRRPVAEL